MYEKSYNAITGRDCVLASQTFKFSIMFCTSHASEQEAILTESIIKMFFSTKQYTVVTE